MQTYLSTSGLAARAGLKPDVASSYGSQGLLPDPDAMIGTLKGWTVETVDAWIALRADAKLARSAKAVKKPVVPAALPAEVDALVQEVVDGTKDFTAAVVELLTPQPRKPQKPARDYKAERAAAASRRAAKNN